MKQTAVEFLIEQIKSKADNLPTNTKENRMAKGIYVDCLIMARQAKEKEKQQQGYSEEDMKQFGLYLGDNLKKLKNKTIDEIFEKYKNL